MQSSSLELLRRRPFSHAFECKYKDFFQDFQIFPRETYEGGTSLHHEFELRSSLLTLGRVDASITLHSLNRNLGAIHDIHTTLGGHAVPIGAVHGAVAVRCFIE